MVKVIKVNSLSPSTVRQYTEGCPEQVFLDKVERAPKHGVSAAALLGSSFHSVAESYFRGLLLRNEFDLDVLQRIFEARWNSVNQNEIVYGKDGKEDLFAKALELIKLLKSYKPPKEVLAVEIPLNYKLSEDLEVIGTPDLVFRDNNGILTILDVKTSSKAYSDWDKYAATSQTYTYSLAYKEPVKLKLLLFIKSKTAKMVEMELDSTTIEFKEWENRFLQTKRGIENHIRYRVRSWSCKTCSYKYICNSNQFKKAA